MSKESWSYGDEEFLYEDEKRPRRYSLRKEVESAMQVENEENEELDFDIWAEKE